MGIPNLFVYTHDSVAVGEDGPTHQPVEQLSNLRSMPNLDTWRPCDTVETAIAWHTALKQTEIPSALVFTRQKTEAQLRDADTFQHIERGGYVLRDCDEDPDVILIATGSEVELAMQAAEALTRQRCDVRVVSMPCVEVFLRQEEAYRQHVLPPTVRARVAVEAGHPDSWYQFTGLDGAVVGIDRFGLSAPGPEAMEVLGMTVENVIDAAQACMAALGIE